MDTQTNPNRRRIHRRGLLLAGVGTGVAAVAAVAAVAFAVPTIMGTSMATTQLTQPSSGGPAAMCAEVTPEAVAAAHTSFRAEVTGVEDGVATLSVKERYKGDAGNTVTVTQGVGAGIDGEPIVFVEGESYLVSANSDGMIVTCGVSGVADTDLTAVYDAAFR